MVFELLKGEELSRDVLRERFMWAVDFTADVLYCLKLSSCLDLFILSLVFFGCFAKVDSAGVLGEEDLVEVGNEVLLGYFVDHLDFLVLSVKGV